MKIYVGKLSRRVTAADLRRVFEHFGRVASATITRDKRTELDHRSLRFGFVEMPTEAEARRAISGLNGKELKGKRIIVDEAL